MSMYNEKILWYLASSLATNTILQIQLEKVFEIQEHGSMIDGIIGFEIEQTSRMWSIF